jgi:cellulose biosynthesis protein BcsQ
MAGVRGGARPFTKGDPLMKTVAFYNNKGGVGKTTFAVHFALHAAQNRGLRTVAVGLDRQGDMMRWLSGGEAEIGDGSVYRHSANAGRDLHAESDARL